MAHFSTLFPELFDNPPYREFTPAEAARLSGMFPEIQRVHRARLTKAGISPAFPSAPFGWSQVMQIALMVEILAAGLSPESAWKIAASESLRQKHEYDLRAVGSAPYFVLARFKAGAWEALTQAGSIDFNTANEWWGSRGHWFNYSLIQRRVVAAYELMRAGE